MFVFQAEAQKEQPKRMTGEMAVLISEKMAEPTRTTWSVKGYTFDSESVPDKRKAESREEKAISHIQFEFAMRTARGDKYTDKFFAGASGLSAEEALLKVPELIEADSSIGRNSKKYWNRIASDIIGTVEMPEIPVKDVAQYFRTSPSSNSASIAKYSDAKQAQAAPQASQAPQPTESQQAANAEQAAGAKAYHGEGGMAELFSDPFMQTYLNRNTAATSKRGEQSAQALIAALGEHFVSQPDRQFTKEDVIDFIKAFDQHFMVRLPNEKDVRAFLDDYGAKQKPAEIVSSGQ